MLYSNLKYYNEVIDMDLALMKKLDKQGFIFTVLHSVIFLNFAAELLLL